MSTGESNDTRAAFSVRTAELAVAGLFFLLGAVVIYQSVRLGAKWGDNGPEDGYFPFYLGVMVCVSSAINFFNGLRIQGARNKSFVEVGQLRLVLSVLIPSAIFVGTVGWLGIYLSGAIFIAVFMRWLGKYSWLTLSAVSVGVIVAFFLVFEIWFKVPLPKGPLEAWLGLN